MTAVRTGGLLVTTGGRVQRAPAWADLASWRHSWDVADADHDHRRVYEVPDPHGGRPLRRIPGAFGLLGASLATYGALPGPLWLRSSPRFNGRPAFAADTFDTAGTSAFPLFAGLTPNTDVLGLTGAEDSDNYFDPPAGYAQPYWLAVLARGHSNHPIAAIIDAAHGGVGTGPTIGNAVVIPGVENLQASNYGTLFPPLQILTLDHHASVDETYLCFCHVNGASSFLEFTWRTAAGQIQTERETGSLREWRYLELFFGWVHGHYISAAGVGLGVPSEAELDRVRTWGSYWLPPAAALADEVS